MLEFHNDEVNDKHGLIDTLLFDTIFVEFGSVTKYFKVVNPHNDAINISSVQLMGGEASKFRINIDGVPGNTATDVEIEPKDSIYVFAEVTIDPGDINTPFIVEDSVRFNLNGNEQYVKLLAYGQNAHFYFEDTLTEITNWRDDLPHVILRYVLIDTLQELNIHEGVNVHLHNGASIVAKGNLNVLGTKDSIVSFRGTRLEHDYQDTPGQWGTMFFGRNTINHLEWFDIKNAVVGLAVGLDLTLDFDQYTPGNAANLTLRNGKIANSFGPNITSYLSNIDAENCLFYDSNQSLLLTWGGVQNYKHCTIDANVFGHNDPVVTVANYLETQSNDTVFINAGIMEATFTNTIISGGLEQEIAYVTDEEIKDGLIVNLNNCLLKDTANNPIPTYNENCIFNAKPLFVSPGDMEDFTLSEDSPCIDAGTAIGIMFDLNGNMRTDGAPDIGCYEFTP